MATIKMLYLGRDNEGTHEVFAHVADEEIESGTYNTSWDNRSYYDRKIFKKLRGMHLRPGTVVSVEEGENEGSIKPGTMRNVGLWGDPMTRAALQEQERLRQLAERHAKESKADDALRESLRVARAVYHKSGSLHQAQTLARIVAIITS